MDLLKKAAIFIISLSLVWWLVKDGLLHTIVDSVLPIRFVAELMAGVFYASFLTSPLSIAMLAVLAERNNPILIALFGGLGAVLGDFIILKFFKAELSNEADTISRDLQLQKVNNFLKKWRLEFLTPMLGAIIIASPLPDELGLVLLGVSHLKYYQIALLSYILNTAGILLIVTPINLLS